MEDYLGGGEELFLLLLPETGTTCSSHGSAPSPVCVWWDLPLVLPSYPHSPSDWIVDQIFPQTQTF